MADALPSWYRPRPDRPVYVPDRHWARLPKFYTHLPGAWFFIGQLAEALGRTPGTLRRWEMLGWLPASPFLRTSADACGRRRLYSTAQIDAAVRIGDEEGLLDTRRCCPGDTDFPRRVAEEWAAIEARTSAFSHQPNVSSPRVRRGPIPWAELSRRPPPRQPWLLPP